MRVIDNQDQALEVNEDEMAEFIFDKLVSYGIAASREEIKVILDLEFQYLQHIGVVEG